jgi:hypothetical protein
MVTLKAISEGQALDCMKHGEFGKEIIASNSCVAIVLTQGWCPQWSSLQHTIEQLNEPRLDVWMFVYDHASIFEEFLEFKEGVFGNDEIPYVRYYRGGRLVGESNAVSKQEFVERALGKK